MNFLAASALLLTSLQPSAITWQELELGQGLRLSEKIQISQEGPSYPAGTRLTLVHAEPLAIPGQPVMFYRLAEYDCAHPEWKSEIEIITPAGNSDASAVGVEIEGNCRWGVYVEEKDLFQPSFLAPLNVSLRPVD